MELNALKIMLAAPPNKRSPYTSIIKPAVNVWQAEWGSTSSKCNALQAVIAVAAQQPQQRLPQHSARLCRTTIPQT